MAGISKKTHKKLPMRTRISSKFDLPADSFSMCPLIEICGDGEVFISGCKSLLNYTENNVSFDSDMGVINVYGRHLTINSFSERRMTVVGDVRDVKIGDPENEEGAQC